jgi:2-polyprenyl-3-methyl-5-hydroxy-6-metoxy-1,4-benzoquinol methylase
MTNWAEYWNIHHVDSEAVHLEALEFVRRLEGAIHITPDMRVLDFGCGSGHAAAAIAPKVRSMHIWDAHATPLRRARQRLHSHRNVAVLDLSEADTHHLPHRFDLVVVNSVVQYMDAHEVPIWLRRWAGMLAEHGHIVLSDLIPPGHHSALDLLSLIHFNPIVNLRRLGKDARSYLRARTRASLNPVDRSELRVQAEAAGLHIRFLPSNLTHFTWRYAAVLAPSGEGNRVPVWGRLRSGKRAQRESQGES